jgi:hypothetical protein
MPRGWTTISIYLDQEKYEYYSRLAELRAQSRNSMLVQLIDYAIIAHAEAGDLLEDWDGNAEETPRSE